MGSKKGVPHRKWTKEEKLKIVKLHLEERKSTGQIEREYSVNNSLVSAWVKKYLEEGEQGLENKATSGNKFAALHTGR